MILTVFEANKLCKDLNVKRNKEVLAKLDLWCQIWDTIGRGYFTTSIYCDRGSERERAIGLVLEELKFLGFETKDEFGQSGRWITISWKKAYGNNSP